MVRSLILGSLKCACAAKKIKRRARRVVATGQSCVVIAPMTYSEHVAIAVTSSGLGMKKSVSHAKGPERSRPGGRRWLVHEKVSFGRFLSKIFLFIKPVIV